MQGGLINIAKEFNILLSVILIVAFWISFGINLFLSFSLGIVSFKAGYVQVEVIHNASIVSAMGCAGL